MDVEFRNSFQFSQYKFQEILVEGEEFKLRVPLVFRRPSDSFEKFQLNETFTLKDPNKGIIIQIPKETFRIFNSLHDIFRIVSENNPKLLEKHTVLLEVY